MNSATKHHPPFAPKTGKRSRAPAKPLGDLASKVLSPVIARRAGMNQDLLAAWKEMCGPRHAAISRPERIAWPRRASDDEPFEPGTLFVACDGAAAVLLQHEADEIIARINRFFGFNAIARLRIVQRPVSKLAGDRPGNQRPRPAPLDKARREKLDAIVSGVDDSQLKSTLERLGSNVFAKASAEKPDR